jgi:hypothetical protein
MVLNATFNNISVISWRSVLLVGETEVFGENHPPAASQVVQHVIVSLTSDEGGGCLCQPKHPSKSRDNQFHHSVSIQVTWQLFSSFSINLNHVTLFSFLCKALSRSSTSRLESLIVGWRLPLFEIIKCGL